MAAARAPPRQQVRDLIHLNRKERALMDSNDRISEFLAAVEDLRGDDDGVRTTAHTSSVSDKGWPPAEAAATDAVGF